MIPSFNLASFAIGAKGVKAAADKIKNQGVIKMEDYIKNPSLNANNSKPIATDHTHEKPKGDVSRPESNFMGSNQIETFKSLTSPESVDRSGRAISSDELDPVGIKPAMNPPMATPIDIDKKGINSLYNEF
jgi:hypothetical protein